MGARRWLALGALAAGLSWGEPLDAQGVSGGTVLRGRALDAITRAPVAEARVTGSDSTVVAITDEDGDFVIPYPGDEPLSLIVERFGYVAQRFVLEPEARSRVNLLLLPPEPVEIEGIGVFEEDAITALVSALEERRNTYPYLVHVLDRTTLETFASERVLDVVRRRAPSISLCRSDPSQLCIPGRLRTPADLNREFQVGVCVDGLAAPGPGVELAALSVDAVALIELYVGPEDDYIAPHVRIYTASWLVRQAKAGRTVMRPLFVGC
jgi:hypothetical protein